MIPNRYQPASRRAFTIIELVVVILIIVTLMAIIIPVLGLAKQNAQKAATQALLQTIATALEDYDNSPEFGGAFPPSTPGTFGAGSGAVAINRGSVMLAEALTGFLPFQADGAGYDTTTGQLYAYTDPNSGQKTYDPPYGFRLHVGGHGKIYPPLVRVDDPLSFRLVPGTVIAGTPVNGEQVFIDRWGNEILYYRAIPAVQKGTNGLPDLPRTITKVFDHAGANFSGIFVIEDNRTVKDQNGKVVTLPDPSQATTMAFWSTLGCSAQNQVNPGDVVIGADSYLLISAGPDGIYFTGDDIIQVRK